MAAPRGLAASGRRLWSDVSDCFELDPMQAVILEAACKQRDRAEVFAPAAASGDATAARQERDSVLAMARLLAAMRVPDDAGRRPKVYPGPSGVKQPTTVSARDRLRSAS